MPKIYIKENQGKILEFSFIKTNSNNNNVDNSDNNHNDVNENSVNIIEIELNENDEFFQKLINDQINWNEWRIKNNQLIKLSLFNVLDVINVPNVLNEQIINGFFDMPDVFVERTVGFDDLWHWNNLNQKKHFQTFLT